MLVKFISFVITVFGTKRYKPLLFACLALVVSLTGISAVVTLTPSGKAPAASTASAEEQHTTKDTLKPQTPGTQVLRTDEAGQAVPQQSTESSSQNAASKPTPSPTSPGNDPQNAPTPDIMLSASKITVSKGNTAGESVKAALHDASVAEWTISTVEPVQGLQITPDTPQNSATATFTIKATSSTPAGTYTLTVYAKNAAQNVTPKSLTIIVTE